MNDDFWHDSQEAWQALTPEGQSLLRAAGVVVATIVAAQAIGWLVGRKLRAFRFDAAFRRPWLPAPAAEHSEAQSLTPTRLVTGLIRLTIWGGGLWCLAYLYDWSDLGRGLEWIAVRAWVCAGVILGALCLSRQFSAKLVEAVQASPLRQKLDGWLPPAGVRDPRASGAAMAASLLIDAVMILLVTLVAADQMGWTLTGNALAATWQLALHVSSAGVAILIGWGGARWVRDQVVADATPGSSPARVGHFAAVGVMGCATVLAIVLLAGTSATFFGLAMLALFVLLLWPAQAWLPDIYAGAVLREQNVTEVRIDGIAYRLGAVGLVKTELLHPDGPQVRRNRVVLQAHIESPSGGDGPRSDAGSHNGKPEEMVKAKE
jgi:hypothetical protein